MEILLQACRDGVDAVLVCCSASDREGWLDMPKAVTEATQPADRAAVAVVLTRYLLINPLPRHCI